MLNAFFSDRMVAGSALRRRKMREPWEAASHGKGGWEGHCGQGCHPSMQCAHLLNKD